MLFAHHLARALLQLLSLLRRVSDVPLGLPAAAARRADLLLRFLASFVCLTSLFGSLKRLRGLGGNWLKCCKHSKVELFIINKLLARGRR
jgi:hypothetical protein